MADILSAAAPAPLIENAASPLAAPSDDNICSTNTNPTTTKDSASNNKTSSKNDGASSTNKKSKADNNSNDPPLRQGKWTREEEEYVHCLIDEFKTGMMPLAEGTSLRTFLSKMLGCAAMRISKKFVGSNYNGKQVYARRTGADRLSNEEVRERRAKLCDLERKFLAKIGSSKRASGGGGNGTSSFMDASAPISTDSVLNMHSAAMAAVGAGDNLQSLGTNQSGVSVSASGVELRNLINQVAVSQTQKQQQQQQMGGNHNSEFPRNLSSMFEVSLNDQTHHPSSASHQNNNANSASNQSLQNIFQGLLASSGSSGRNNNNTNSNGSRNNVNAGNHNNSHNSFNGGSLEAFQALMQQQQNGAPRPNSRAAAAGRALLQSGSGLGLGGLTAKPPSPRSSSSNEVSKPLSSFTDDELADELRKRSSLRKIMNSLGIGGGHNTSSSDNMNQQHHQTSFAAGLQDSLQQAADAKNSNAISSLIRNTSIDMSNLIERQGSIDSLSNLANRSRLQSIPSMGSLLDPLLGDRGENMGSGSNTGTSGNINSSWAGGNRQGGVANFSQLDLSNLGGLAAKVSQDNMGSFSSSRRTADELMQSLGMRRASLNNFTSSANPAAASNNSASRPASNSGLNLASLLNNEEALRRLEASAPSSLNQNFSFQHQDNNGGSLNNGAQQQQSQQSNDNNTAIAQFLLQKKLMEGQNGGRNNNNMNSDQQQLMMNVAAAASCNASSGNGNSGGCMDPFMSSLLSSLRSSGDDKQQFDDMDSLKRKFLSQEGLSGQDDEQRRTKSFR